MYGCMESFGTPNSGALNIYLYINLTERHTLAEHRKEIFVNLLRYLQGQKGVLKHLVSNLQGCPMNPPLCRAANFAKDGLSQLVFTTHPISMLPSWCLWRPGGWDVLLDVTGVGWQGLEDGWSRTLQALKPKGQQMMNIRMMFPFTMVCDSCKEYNYTGGLESNVEMIAKFQLLAKRTSPYPWSIPQLCTPKPAQNEGFFS